MVHDTKVRLVEQFLSFLRSESVDTIFGVPGGLIHPFFDAVELHPEIELIVSKHEQGAVFMADGYARARGGLGVSGATSGPGATNMLTAAAVAYHDGLPLLLLTGQAPSHALGKGAAQETSSEGIDVVAMFRPVTKYSAMVVSADRFAAHLNRALRRALSGKRGPVHLNVPVDFWNTPLSRQRFTALANLPGVGRCEAEKMRQAARALVEAERPVILAGAGVQRSRAKAELIALAREVGAAVATTPTGKGAIAEDDPLCLGVFGLGGHEPAREAIMEEDVDVLFCVGASMSETTTFNWSPQVIPKDCLIHLDIDVEVIGRNYPVDIALLGDARQGLSDILAEVKKMRSERDRRRPPREQSKPSCRHGEPALRESEAVPLTPQRWRAELDRVLPTEAMVFSDVGGHMLFNIHDLTIRQGQEFVLNLGFGSMGHGTAAPIGAALGTRHRPMIAIIGDACFMMNGMEVLTAVEYDVPVVWIVENNQMHGISWHGSKLVNGGRPMEAIAYQKPVAIGAIARAMGLSVWRVEEPGQIGTALEAALGCEGPALIEVVVDPGIAPPVGYRARTIAGEGAGEEA